MGLFRKKSNPQPQRYVVRPGSQASLRYTVQNVYLAPSSFWVVFDAETGGHVFKIQGSRLDSAEKSQVMSRADALNRENGSKLCMPYIFDTLAAQVVYEDESIQNCRDHAAALNRSDEATLSMGIDARWQAVATALVRTQLEAHPSTWQIRDNGIDILVLASDVVIAKCETYADAASIQALGEMAWISPVVRQESQPRPVRSISPR